MLFISFLKEGGRDLDRVALCWWVLVGVLARVKVSGRQLVAGRRLQLELLSAGGSQVVRLRVKVESPGDGQGSDDLITWMKTGWGGARSPFCTPATQTDGKIGGKQCAAS